MVSSRPIIDMRLPDGQRAAGMWEVVPEPHLTIRCHRYVDITLEKLIGMGMVSRSMANFLYAAVRGRRSILVIGVPGAGKTTLLRALAQCVDRFERFATLETEYELFLHKIFDTNAEGVTKPRYPLLVPIEARPGTGETGPNGRPAGEMSIADLFPASLRHSLQRLLIGEMRGEEIVPTLMSMARGYRGSMASFHANSARKAFNSLQSAVTFHAHNVSAHAAMSLVADALDLVVFVDREETASGTIRYVSEILEVHELAENGQPASTMIYGPDPAREEFDPRGYPLHLPEGNALWARRAGLDLTWLHPSRGDWAGPFPERQLA
jgi:Flp pilus assembly CpaF family ATPase